MSILQKLSALFGSGPPGFVGEKVPVANEGLQPPSAPKRHAGAQWELAVADVQTCSSEQALGEYMQHYNGRVREAALKRAADLASPLLLPAAVGRLNDWVPQVRLRARDLVLRLLPLADANTALQCIPAIQHLKQAGRDDHSAWISLFEQALVDLAGGPRLVAGIRDPDSFVARTCYRLVEEYGLATPAMRISQALSRDADIVVARHAVAALGQLEGDARAESTKLALRSHIGMVRAVALRSLLAEDGNEHEALAVDMLADSYDWVRLVAAAYLGRRGIDSAAIHAARLASPETTVAVLRASLMGLAESGAAHHIDAVRGMTAHPSARVQVQAYLAWLRLEPEKKDEIARLVLTSRFQRVRKLVLSMFRKHNAYVASDGAIRLLQLHDDVELMLAYAAHQPWNWLELILQLEPRSRTEPTLRELLARELARWEFGSAHTQAQPTEAQRLLFKQEDTMRNLQALLRELADSTQQPGLNVLRLL